MVDVHELSAEGEEFYNTQSLLTASTIQLTLLQKQRNSRIH